MKAVIDNPLAKGTVDPTELSDWDEVEPMKLMGLGGFINQWFAEYCMGQSEDPLKDHMDKAYGFGLFEMTGGTIDEDLIHQYPGDPPLHPAFHVQAQHNNAELVCYQHAIFAMRDQPEDEWFITRMD